MIEKRDNPRETPVADPGFDLRGAWTLSTGGWGLKSIEVLNVKVKVICKRVLAVFLLKLCLKLIASAAIGEKKEEKN